MIPALHTVTTLATVASFRCTSVVAGLTAAEFVIHRILIDLIIIENFLFFFIEIKALIPKIIIKRIYFLASEYARVAALNTKLCHYRPYAKEQRDREQDNETNIWKIHGYFRVKEIGNHTRCKAYKKQDTECTK